MCMHVCVLCVDACIGGGEGEGKKTVYVHSVMP